jgi:hypothetical protein
MEILEIQTDARRKDLLQFLGLYSIMDFPYTQLKSSDEGIQSFTCPLFVRMVM